MELEDLFSQAAAVHASDIHIEPLEKEVQIRWRIDGVLQVAARARKEKLESIISRLKILAELDIANKRLPQDGRVFWQKDGRRLDLRISTLPTLRGEKAVIRILDGQRIPLKLSALGLDPAALALLQQLLLRRQGLILICGPTGSGKTTTLYAALNELKSESVSIATLEDPVEILLEGISQSQVNVKGGLMFPNGLRALLRQDPDILVVGEIRDQETARIAVQGALTGHVILSTLHAPSAVEAAVRLMDMGIEPYLAADALAGVVSQRLVRYQKADGSYQGRFCLGEVVPVGRQMKEKIREKASAAALQLAAQEDGAVLMEEVISRVLAKKLTDRKEIRRVYYGGS